MTTQQVRLRFAPSPTGPLHIGGARSALFNWLLARKYGGKLIVRVEDTDLDRSSRESEENIKDALRWLGLDWDEGVDIGGDYGPYRQTERLEIYRKYTEKLLAENKAYYCFCSEEELERERQAAVDKGETPLYSGRCRNLEKSEQESRLAQWRAAGKMPPIRLRVQPGQQIVIPDLVRGTVVFESDGVGDYIIVKSDGYPVYNYAVVIDDLTMDITHVIRGEEHLSNTPRQVLIYDALGETKPEFGHISLILGTDRTKMSKRHGATAVEQYRKKGYLPEALLNFLVLLGWAPGGEQEIFSLEELSREFSLDRVAKNPAVFDVDKLNWISAHYMKKAKPETIAEMALPHLQEAGYLPTVLTEEDEKWLVQMVSALQDYISYAAQIVEHAGIFFGEEVQFENAEAKEILLDSDVPQVMEAFRAKVAEVDTLDKESVRGILKGIGKELKLGGKKVFMPVRVALTGQMHGPELFDIIPLLGKEKVAKRLDHALGQL